MIERPGFIFFGQLAKDIELHTTYPRDEIFTWSGLSSCLTRSPEHCLTFSVPSHDWSRIGRYNSDCSELWLIGSGQVCNHCDTYSPSGRAVCFNCDAPTATKSLVNPVETNLYLATSAFNLDLSPTVGQSQSTLHLEFCGSGDIDIARISQAIRTQATSVLVQSGISLMRGYYLCEYCGSATTSGMNCQGCGGNQLPLRELIEMEQSCSYCSNPAVGGIVCKKCARSVSGISVDTILGDLK